MGKKRRRKGGTARLEPLKQQLRSEGLLAGHEIVVEPGGEEKMSEVLMLFVEPYMEEALTCQAFEQLISIGAVAWNAALVPGRERQKLLDEAIEAGLSAVDKDTRRELRSFLGALIARKERVFPTNKRFIVSYRVSRTKNSYHVSVASTLEGPDERSRMGRELQRAGAASSIRTPRAAILTGLALFALTTLALHGLQPALGPRDEAVSYYVHGKFGWLLTLGLIALGTASLALARALTGTTEGPGARPGRWLLRVWGLGVLLGGVFPADPPGNWSAPPSATGMIHGNAAMVAFLALPLGALMLANAFRRDERWKEAARLLFGLAVGTAVSLVGFFASLTPVFIRPGPPVLLGLSERILLGVYVVWLAAVAIRLPTGSSLVPR